MNKADINKHRNLIAEHKDGANGLCVVEGFHAVKHAMRFEAEFEFIAVRSREDVVELAKKLAPDLADRLVECTMIELGSKFDTLTNGDIRTGILAVAKISGQGVAVSSADDGFSVMLDSPRDINNVGAIIRTLAGLGVRDLYITGNLNAWHHRAIRAGAGLQFALNIRSTLDAETALLKLQRDGAKLVCFDERGKELDSKLVNDVRGQENIVLVFGSERRGISKLLIENAEEVVRLPMQQGVSSYNLAASVAMAASSIVNINKTAKG